MSLIDIKERKADGKKNPTRYYSHKQETKVAKEFGGTTTKNSGATLFDKGDVSLDKFLVECKTKTTNSNSIGIQKEWLEKIKKESLFVGKDYYTLAFNFGPDSKNYFILDEYEFQLFIELLNKNEGE